MMVQLFEIVLTVNLQFPREPTVSRLPLNWSGHEASFTEAKFKRLYRVSKKCFLTLSRLVKPLLYRPRSRTFAGLPVADHRVMLAITLRFLAGASYLDLGWPYGISDATVYKFVGDVLEALDSCLDTIKFPQSESKFLCLQLLKLEP